MKSSEQHERTLGGSCLNCFSAFVSYTSNANSVTHTVTTSNSTVLSCRIDYRAATGNEICRWVVSRLTTLYCNPITGICTQTWNSPQVVTIAGGGASCGYTFTSVSDTNAVTHTAQANFPDTLTAN